MLVRVRIPERERKTVADAIAAHNKAARAVAIVERLPKTADGVPIVPGMKVYVSVPPFHEEVADVVPMKSLSANKVVKTTLRSGWLEEHKAGDCYSTPEAAKAAQAAARATVQENKQ